MHFIDPVKLEQLAKMTYELFVENIPPTIESNTNSTGVTEPDISSKMLVDMENKAMVGPSKHLICMIYYRNKTLTFRNQHSYQEQK